MEEVDLCWVEDFDNRHAPIAQDWCFTTLPGLDRRRRGWERLPQSPHAARLKGRKVWKRPRDVPIKDSLVVPQAQEHASDRKVLGSLDANCPHVIKRQRLKDGLQEFVPQPLEFKSRPARFLSTLNDFATTPRRKQSRPCELLKPHLGRPASEEDDNDDKRCDPEVTSQQTCNPPNPDIRYAKDDIVPTPRRSSRNASRDAQILANESPKALLNSPQIATTLLRRESIRQRESPERRPSRSKSPQKKMKKRDTLQEREILQQFTVASGLEASLAKEPETRVSDTEGRLEKTTAPLPTPPRKTRSGTRFSDDTSMLQDFLNRAQAKKAASQLVVSPIKSPLKTAPPPTPPTASLQPAESNASCRRSNRTRLPTVSKTPPSLIPLRRTDGTDTVVLQKSQAQELAIMTRTNTRRNMGPAKTRTLTLQALNSFKQESNARQRKDPASNGKTVNWAARLVDYEDGKGMSEETRPEDEPRPRVRRIRALGNVNGTPAKKGPPIKSSSSTAPVLFSANGTPAPRRRTRQT